MNTASDATSDDEVWEPSEHDRDPANITLRAGYIRGMAMRLPTGDDRTFLLRASRSLLAYARVLSAQATKIE